MTPPVTWAAGPSRIAHATRFRERRTLCGDVPTRPQFEWPRTGYCERCVAGLEPREVPVAARKAATL